MAFMIYSPRFYLMQKFGFCNSHVCTLSISVVGNNRVKAVYIESAEIYCNTAPLPGHLTLQNAREKHITNDTYFVNETHMSLN